MSLKVTLPAPVEIKKIVETTESKSELEIIRVEAYPQESRIILGMEDGRTLQITGDDYAAIQADFSAALAAAFGPFIAREFGLEE
jgi:hypothetical protein